MRVTKGIVRAYLEGGVDRADEVMPGLVGSLFETEDLKGAVEVVPGRGPRQRHVRGTLGGSATLIPRDA